MSSPTTPLHNGTFLEGAQGHPSTNAKRTRTVAIIKTHALDHRFDIEPRISEAGFEVRPKLLLIMFYEWLLTAFKMKHPYSAITCPDYTHITVTLYHNLWHAIRVYLLVISDCQGTPDGVWRWNRSGYYVWVVRRGLCLFCRVSALFHFRISGPFVLSSSVNPVYHIISLITQPNTFFTFLHLLFVPHPHPSNVSLHNPYVSAAFTIPPT